MERFYPFAPSGKLTPLLAESAFWTQAYDDYLQKYCKLDLRKMSPFRILTKKRWLPNYRRDMLRSFLKPFKLKLSDRPHLPEGADAGDVLVAILEEPQLRAHRRQYSDRCSASKSASDGRSARGRPKLSAFADET